MPRGLLGTKDPTFNERGERIPHSNKNSVKVLHTPDNDLTRDLQRGRDDPVFFCARFLGIRLNRGQRRWVRAAAQRREDGYSAAFLTTAVSAGNRAGKTLCMAVIVAHACFYKLGIRPPKPGSGEDSLRWARAPFQWFHIAPQQGIAELVFNELSRIFQGNHVAQQDRESGQNRGCPLIDLLGEVVLMDKKFRGEYLWIRFHPSVGGAEIHFRTTDEKAKALLGIDMNGISFDEAAFELYLDTIRHEVLNLRRLSTGGPIHFISTPTEGHNAFYDLWEEGNPENPSRDTNVISLRLSTRDNIGYGLSREAFDNVIKQVPEYLVPQNIDGYFIEARGAYFHAPSVEAIFSSDIPVEEAPIPAHRYAQGVDLGIASDATWALTLDMLPGKKLRGVRARRRMGRQTLPAVVNMVNEGHMLYGPQSNAACTTIIDSTGLGGKMFKQEFSMIRPLREFDFAGTKARKLELLSDLKAAIDRGDLQLPRGGVWNDVRRQLLGYKLEDKKLEQDAVMTLAIAVRFAIRHNRPATPLPHFSYFGASD